MNKLNETKIAIAEGMHRFVNLLGCNAPDVLLNLEGSLLLSRLLVVYPGILDEFVKNVIIPKVRQSSGLCVNCDNPIAPIRTHPPQCETCRVNEEIEFPSQN